MVDDHVDRPGVEAQQCVKLTGTNGSIDLENSSIRMDKSQNLREPQVPESRFVRITYRKCVSGDLILGIQNVLWPRKTTFGFCGLDMRGVPPFLIGNRAPVTGTRFDDLVVMAEVPHPIPSRTRP